MKITATAPTYWQGLAIRSAGLDPRDWRVVAEGFEEIALVCRRTGEYRTVRKGEKQCSEYR